MYGARVVTIRPLAVGECGRVVEIDVSEEDDVVFVQRGREIVTTSERWARPRRDARGWMPLIEYWRPALEAGGVALGAFDGERLVGMAVLRVRLTRDTAQLAALFVDREHRRRGVAGALVDEVERLARVHEARFLYVSATPSRSAVGFYGSRGFEPVAEPHPELFELEPDDVHMVELL